MTTFEAPNLWPASFLPFCHQNQRTTTCWSNSFISSTDYLNPAAAACLQWHFCVQNPEPQLWYDTGETKPRLRAFGMHFWFLICMVDTGVCSWLSGPSCACRKRSSATPLRRVAFGSPPPFELLLISFGGCTRSTSNTRYLTIVSSDLILLEYWSAQPKLRHR